MAWASQELSLTGGLATGGLGDVHGYATAERLASSQRQSAQASRHCRPLPYLHYASPSLRPALPPPQPAADAWVALAGPLTHIPQVLVWLLLLLPVYHADTGSWAVKLYVPYPEAAHFLHSLFACGVIVSAVARAPATAVTLPSCLSFPCASSACAST